MLKKQEWSLPCPKTTPPCRFICDALDAHGLMDIYLAHLPYQQNDYIGWVMRAKREATRQKRLNQMVEELEKGGV
jgi:uncharacterized protein YdeI (YjbR/CyaY-like superfamily)